jgi:exosortase
MTSLAKMGPGAGRLSRLPLRAAALVGLVALAYHYSLSTLARGLTLQTPLAYLALVPLIALALGVVKLRLEPRSRPIHDRQVDWIVGIGLLGAAAAILLILPSGISAAYWLNRLDLLSLPLFVAGLVTMLFGVRRLWVLKGPILFLLLAWPMPYVLLMGGATTAFTEFSARLVGIVTAAVGLAAAVPGDESMFLVGSGARSFAVSIGSACSGVNSLVGFLLLGIALGSIVRGPRLRRLAWLAGGLILVFALNVLRILAVIAAGAALGQEAALDVLHPVAGLLVFNLGVLVMLALVPVFRLRIPASPVGDVPSELSAPSPIRRARAALLVTLGLAVVLAGTNAAFARYESISSGLADARLQPFDIRTAQVPQWESRYAANFAQAAQSFGPSATWDRLLYSPMPASPIQSTLPVWVDVVTTADPGTFAAFGIEACYRFHGYRIESLTTVDVGAGVQAQLIDYHNPVLGGDWSALWWEWPFQVGGQTRYERIVLFIANGPAAQYGGVAGIDVAGQSQRFTDTDRFLAALARFVVRSQLAGGAS